MIGHNMVLINADIWYIVIGSWFMAYVTDIGYMMTCHGVSVNCDPFLMVFMSQFVKGGRTS